MYKAVFDILQHINEGIIILNEKMDIMFWNNYMEYITNVTQDMVINKKIYDVLPRLNKNYIKQSMNDVMKRGCKSFFSAAMHKGLITENAELNLRVSRYEYDE